jgi:hypothetical protein
MKFISPKIHGIIDYVFVLFLIAAPVFFGFDNFTAIFTYVLAMIYLLVTFATDFDSGIFKFISFRTHGIIELVVGIVIILLAFTLFRDTRVGKLFYICFGAAILLTWLFTDYRRLDTKKNN